jgi:archaemetzincin
MQQILTTYVLEQILIPNLASDAAAFLALTTSDLWPAEGWNFVFGQAYIEQHVGVWSLYRNGDPHKNRQDFNLCLIRTLKTAAHETGHIFSIEHCIKYECVMNGSNHREESDSHPLEFCPECLAKVCWITGADIKQRYKKLAGFCRRNSLTKEAELYDKSINVLKEN